jgi:excisionase family DNA binding protein
MAKSIEKKPEEFTMLTVQEVAEYLRMSEAKVYRLVKEGRLPVIHIGRAWRFRKDLLDQWLIKCTEESLKVDEHPGRD